jgi:hypothetical protein
MKCNLKNFPTYIYLQIYVAFAIIFFSKKKLMRIAIVGRNHPLVIFNAARWTRVWWFSILGMIVWFFALAPYFNLIFFGSGTTFFSSIDYQTDEVIYFEKWRISAAVLILGGILSGKLLQLVEIYSSNKMKYFKKYMGNRSYTRSNEKYLNPHLRKI